jgi:hypothetical protein
MCVVVYEPPTLGYWPLHTLTLAAHPKHTPEDPADTQARVSSPEPAVGGWRPSCHTPCDPVAGCGGPGWWLMARESSEMRNDETDSR